MIGRRIAALAAVLLLLLLAPAQSWACWLPVVAPCEMFHGNVLRAGAVAIVRLTPESLLSLGIHATRAGDWQRGAALLAPLSKRFALADDVVALPLARCLINLGDPARALSVLEGALRTARGPWADEARVLAARALIDLGQLQRAEASLDLVAAGEGRILTEADLVRALLYARQGEATHTRALLERFSREDPTFREAFHEPEFSALYQRALGGRPIVLDAEGLTQRAATLLQEQQYQSALQTCLELERRFPAVAGRTGFLWTWAKVYFRLTDREGRETKYSELYARYRNAKKAAGQYRAGIAAWRRGRVEDDDLALAHYRRAFELQPRARDARNALMRGGRLALARGRFADAERFFLDVARSYPRSSNADEARMLAGVCMLADGRPGDAAQLLEELASERGAQTPGALYWAWRARQAQGHERNAAAHLRNLQRRYPRSYYAAMTQLDPAAESWNYDAEMSGLLIEARGDRDQRATAAASVLLQEIGRIDDRELRIGCAARAVRPLTRVLLLIEGNVGSLARPDLKLLLDAAPDTMHGRWAALALYELSGETRWSLRLVYRLMAEDDGARSLDDLPGLDPRRLVYPPTWIELVDAQCRIEDLDPALMLSLIRQESAFDADAISVANARGLCQFIPPMVDSAAASLGLEGLRPDQVYDPELNVCLGVRHLHDLLVQHDGNIVLALAGYNATEPVALTWSERGLAAMPPDLAAEAIMFAETRGYVKTILSNVAVYRRLYRTGSFELQQGTRAN
ncbi:MAG: transglycosylase SLT domain-containing protein [Candidatus Alcyoniella australis]|nr:transglycosylase SLT domain-containing protein [Candidatus Alcyoniella australis]